MSLLIKLIDVAPIFQPFAHRMYETLSCLIISYFSHQIAILELKVVYFCQPLSPALISFIRNIFTNMVIQGFWVHTQETKLTLILLVPVEVS